MLNFNNVSIEPTKTVTELESRSQVCLSHRYTTKWANRVFSKIPIMSANMSCITTIPFASEFERLGCLPCLHKFYSFGNLVSYFEFHRNTFYTLGLREEDFVKFNKVLNNIDLPFIHIDVPNGYISNFYKLIEKVRTMSPDSVIMAGNVCTPEAAARVIRSGADIVKVGIANGENCTTYEKTGIGYPQLQVILDCVYPVEEEGGYLCSDGGLKTPGDACKALVAGADFLMLGTYFGGVSENYAISECTWEDDKQLIYGMASEEARRRHYPSDTNSYRATEGRSSWVTYKGLLETVVQDILGGIRGCCLFTGCSNIVDLKKAKLVKV